MISIIDFNCGNLNSIKNAIKRVNHDCVITSDPSTIPKAVR